MKKKVQHNVQCRSDLVAYLHDSLCPYVNFLLSPQDHPVKFSKLRQLEEP